MGKWVGVRLGQTPGRGAVKKRDFKKVKVIFSKLPSGSSKKQNSTKNPHKYTCSNNKTFVPAVNDLTNRK